MKRLPIWMFFCILLVPAYGDGQTANKQKEESKILAIEAHDEVLGNQLDKAKILAAVRQLEQAKVLDANQPWVYLGLAEATLASGYYLGSWFKKSSFSGGTVPKVMTLIRKALKLDPDHHRAHVKMANMYIILREFESAQRMIERAHKLNDENFYTWKTHVDLIRFWKPGSIDQIRHLLKESLKRVRNPYQMERVVFRLQELANATGDFKMTEKILLAKIAKNPKDPYVHSAYGNFLTNHNRLKEARREVLKAMELGAGGKVTGLLTTIMRRLAKTSYY